MQTTIKALRFLLALDAVVLNLWGIPHWWVMAELSSGE